MATLRISLGTMDMGTQLSKQKSHELIKKFLEKGHQELDTAIMYCNGESEKIVGDLDLCRDSTKVSLATKANPRKGFKYEDVIRQLDTSLKSLQVDAVDIFYLHWPDHHQPIEDTLRAVNQLHQDKKFKEFGISNFKAWEVVNIYHICKSNGWVLPTIYQGMYNSITRDVEVELFPALRKFGIRFYAYNPLAGGLLTGRYEYEDIKEKQPKGRFFGTGKMRSDLYTNRYWKKSFFESIQVVKDALAKQYGEGSVTSTEAALRWMKHHSKLIDGDGIIVGASKVDHLDSNLTSLDGGPLHADVVDAFHQAWLGVKAECPTYHR